MVPAARKYIAADVVCQWLALLANVALFWLIGLFLQQLIEQGADSSAIVQLAGVAALAIIIRLVCQTLAQRMTQEASAAAKCAVRQQVYDKLVRLGPAYRERISTSEAVQISVEGCEQLENYFGLYIPQLFYAVLAPVTLTICLLPLSAPAAIVLLVCVPFIPASIIAVQKIARRVMKNYWGSYTDLGSMFLESIQGLTTLKIYQADEARHETMNREAEGFRKATMRLLSMQLNSINIMDFFAFGGAALGIGCVLWQFAEGNTSFAAAFTVAFLSAEYFIPLRTLGSFFHTAMSGMAAADRMFELLDTPEPARGSRTVDSAHAALSCRGVGYSYDGERVVLSDVDFDAPDGSFIGITGESGSGKSTLAGILTGANGSYTGTVTIGGIDAREIYRASLAETITSVTSKSYLFKGSIRSNLLLAKPNATDEELMEALRRCRLDGFVRASGGLDAPVAAEGANLSGGQRQRLAMARALLHNTPIYIFDEATSNIDAESEVAIISFIHELAQEKTVIMISHRLAALTEADTIYVFDDGRLAQTGTHAQLSSVEGPYARLWKQQEELENLVRAVDGLGAAAFAGVALTDAAFVASDEAVAQADDAMTPRPLPQTADSQAAGGMQSAGAPHPPNRRSHWSVMLSLVKLTRPLFSVMLLAILLGVLGFFAAIFLTVFAAYAMLDIAGLPQGIASFAAMVLIAICGIVRGPLRYGEQLCNHYLAFRILALMRDRVFAALRRLAPAKLEGRDKGDLVSLVTSDVELLEVFYAHTLSPVAIAIVVSVGMTALIASQSLVLGLVALLSYLIVGLAVPLLSSKASGRRGRQVRDRIGDMNTFVLDSLRGLSETLQFGRSKDRSNELRDRMACLVGVERGMKGRAAFAMSLTGAIVMLCDIAMLLVAALLVNSGAIGFSQAFLATAALMSSFGPVIAVANLGSSLQQTFAAGERVLELLDESPQTEEVMDGVALDELSGAAVRRVDFSYGGERVLSDVNLHIAPNSIVQIAGRSGSGKSTLLKLFMRFWDVEKGSVEISGHDIRRINTSSLRNLEGFMTQETYLFSETIRENLLLARPTATEAELAQAVSRAALDGLIARLPQGLDTPLGELGDTLSGGERQRLGLARVFLHDAPFVLLDEPTSNLDSLNEAAVLRALVANREGKTIVLVSHRPSAAAIADVHYSVDRGRIS